MTPSDALPPGRYRFVTGLFIFVLTLLLGGGSGMLLISEYKTNVEETARRDVAIIGGSLARSLAAQFEKAARYGIPLKLLPGVEAYLAQTLSQTSGIARIVVRGPDGREVRSAIGPVAGRDTVTAPISVDGLAVGQVEVTTSPISFSGPFQVLTVQVAIAAVVFALIAGVGGGALAGGALERRRRWRATAMAHNVAGALDGGPASASVGRSAVAQAFGALSRGTRRLGEKWAGFQSYAEELLAVDFDGRLRSDVELIRRETMPRSGQTERGG